MPPYYNKISGPHAFWAFNFNNMFGPHASQDFK